MWLKAWHLIGMVTWFAGLFYLPRLFVYHAMSDDQAFDRPFQDHGTQTVFRHHHTGRRIHPGIRPLDAARLCLAAFGDHLWLQLKLVLLALLVAYHMYCGKLLADFKHDRNRHSHVWYRWFNEVPVLLLIGIILLAVIKPV